MHHENASQLRSRIRIEPFQLRCSPKRTHLRSREGTHPAITTFPRRRRCLSTRAGYGAAHARAGGESSAQVVASHVAAPLPPTRITLPDAHRPCADARYRVVMARVGDHATGGIPRAAGEPEAPTIGAWRGSGVMNGGEVEAESRVTIEARRGDGCARLETRRSGHPIRRGRRSARIRSHRSGIRRGWRRPARPRHDSAGGRA